MDESDGTSDSVLQHKPIWATYNPKWKKEKKRTVEKKKQGDLHGTYGFVLSLADMDEHLIMEDGSLVWTCKDVLQHQNDKMIPLRCLPYNPQNHFKLCGWTLQKYQQVRIGSNTDATTFHLLFECSYSAAIWI
ncbi:uncharacterized protein [Solanum lycopersicum]|uniref:uncharacterized protein isoform X2 n=1 Tax=Solanum lycopersicum TaxID=4081 RepID=UPI0037494343